MTDTLDLDELKRLAAAIKSSPTIRCPEADIAIGKFPALIAEVERLRAEVAVDEAVHKPKPNPELDRLLKDSVEKVKQMTPEELEAMHKAQRESWSRQDMD